MRAPTLAALSIVLAAAGGPAVADEPLEVAFFGIHLIDTSLSPSHEAEDRRIETMSTQLVDALERSSRYVFVDTAPVSSKARLHANLAQCNGCDAVYANELGADLALTGEVQKVSNLILAMTIYLRDAETGALVGGGSADIRGNTDESWQRGTAWLIEHRLLVDR